MWLSNAIKSDLEQENKLSLSFIFQKTYKHNVKIIIICRMNSMCHCKTWWKEKLNARVKTIVITMGLSFWHIQRKCNHCEVMFGFVFINTLLATSLTLLPPAIRCMSNAGCRENIVRDFLRMPKTLLSIFAMFFDSSLSRVNRPQNSWRNEKWNNNVNIAETWTISETI